MRQRRAAPDWSVIVPHLIHPTKVLIIEAMLWIERPLSASELKAIFEGRPDLASVSYHVRSLAGTGVLERIEEQQVRGAWKRIYAFAEDVG